MTNIRLNLHRTFKEIKSATGKDENLDEDWLIYSGYKKKGLEWSDLLTKRAIVIVGEAGMGKTWEFQDKVDQLGSEGIDSFFIPINLVTSQEKFRLALSEKESQFDIWIASNKKAYFFLDAVDEARLNDATALESSLAFIVKALKPCLARVSFVISSRITDWHIEAVRNVIKKQILTPLNISCKDISDSALDNSSASFTEVISPEIEIEVFRLSPLSEIDIKRLAAAHGALPVEEFWSKIKEGQYEHLAARPRDLEWMARRWKHTNKLGSYSELIEAAVSNRLSEKNDCYIAAGEILSSQELRNGSERLSAACVFSGRPFVSLSSEDFTATDVLPSDVLPEWDEKTQNRLLGTALFDEATYGRVKFHHRSSKEYLAACWVAKRLDEGLPLSDAINLFGGSPYETPVLLNSRRATLCWLATINVRIREFIIAQFPEMLMYEGDPECWSTEDVVDAFRGYLVRLETGYQPNWWNDLSEQRRVARKIPANVLNEYLKKFPDSFKITSSLLSLVRHGQIYDCADSVFRIYKDSSQERFKRFAMIVLSDIGTTAHKKTIQSDLISGKFKSNDLIAAALESIEFEAITASELTQVICRAKEEDGYGTGSLGLAVTGSLLPKMTFSYSLKLIEAIYKSIPPKNSVGIFHFEEPRPEDVWKCYVLPECLQHTISLLSEDISAVPSILLEVAIFVQHLRHSRFAKDEDFKRLRDEIEKKNAIRRLLAITVASFGGVNDGYKQLLWGGGLICFQKQDINWLVEQANRQDIIESEREMWFRVAVDVAFAYEAPPKYNALFKALQKFDNNEGSARKIYISDLKNLHAQGKKQNIKWKNEEIARKKKISNDLLISKNQLLADIKILRDGSHYYGIKWLLDFAADRSNNSRYTKVSIGTIEKVFGSEIADAFDNGLAELWRKNAAPSILNYQSNAVPWLGLVGLASLNHSFSKGLNVSNLSSLEISKALQFCVWEFDGNDPWFKLIAKEHASIAISALQPWFEYELQSSSDDSSILRTFDLVLSGPDEIRIPFLKIALTNLSGGQIGNAKIQKKIFDECHKFGLLKNDVAGKLIKTKLAASHTVISEEQKLEWLGEWLALDLPAAWNWIQGHQLTLKSNAEDVAICITTSILRTQWAGRLSGTHEEINVMTALFHFLTPYKNAAFSQPITSDVHGHPIVRLREIIAHSISRFPGAAAHTALLALKAKAKYNQIESEWLHRLLVEHSIAEVERDSLISPKNLMKTGETYCREPQSELDLHNQVMARLLELKTAVEEGPFSDRVLFKKGMDERSLQLWLAARLNDTPRRKFSTRFVVHREPQVDGDKRTDIEVSTGGFKVCIEIKPVDAMRYSALTLTDTLQTQLVKQYLKGGGNSRHGILVLFRLDEKRWKIPGQSKHGEFSDLVKYLEQKSIEIRSKTPTVESLDVIGINCVYKNY